MLKVAINGFGRIGRNAFKVAIEKHPDEIEIVGINDLTSPAVLAHLLKYDSAYGVWRHEVSADPSTLQQVQGRTEQSRSATSSGPSMGGAIVIEGKKYPVFRIGACEPPLERFRC